MTLRIWEFLNIDVRFKPFIPCKWGAWCVLAVIYPSLYQWLSTRLGNRWKLRTEIFYRSLFLHAPAAASPSCDQIGMHPANDLSRHLAVRLALLVNPEIAVCRAGIEWSSAAMLRVNLPLSGSIFLEWFRVHLLQIKCSKWIVLKSKFHQFSHVKNDHSFSPLFCAECVFIQILWSAIPQRCRQV